MRKISVLLATLVLAAMLLVACGAEETSTSGTTPSPEVPPVTADTTATDDSTSLTETVVPSTDTTTTPEIPVTGEEDASRLSNQLDFTVWNQNGEQIGEVDDMILHLDNTRIDYVIVGTGGFLDLGEREILVPWNSLELQVGTGETTGGEPNAFILQADQELFNNTPDFDLNTLPEIGQPAGDWDSEIRAYWESGVVPSTPDPAATVDPNMTATTSSDTTQATATAGTGQATATAGTGQVEGMTLQGAVLASEVLGTAINLSPGQGQGQVQATATVGTGQATATTDASQGSGQGVGNFEGTLNDLIINVDSGDILYAVVNTTFDDGDRWIPVPLSFFQWDAANSAFLLNVNPATITDAPFFLKGEFPDTTVEGWNSEWDTFWQSAGTNP